GAVLPAGSEPQHAWARTRPVHCRRDYRVARRYRVPGGCRAGACGPPCPAAGRRRARWRGASESSRGPWGRRAWRVSRNRGGRCDGGWIGGCGRLAPWWPHRGALDWHSGKGGAREKATTRDAAYGRDAAMAAGGPVATAYGGGAALHRDDGKQG